MKNKPALLLYFVACTVFMLAVMLNNSELMLVTKPIIVPAIFFYYLQEKRRINWSYVVIIMLFFIGDMTVLIDLPDFFVLIVSVFLIAYLFFLKGLVDDLVAIRLGGINRTHLFALLLCVFFLIYLLISIMDVLIEAKTENMCLMVLYGIILVAIGTIASMNYIIKPSRYTTFMIFASLSFVISDVFYILKKDFLEIEILNYLNNFTQIVSYYYLTKYYLLKDSKNEI
ncbi:lysoplasmalogenase family protein [Flavobacterium saliperosum]|uniref:YhhN-like protein n=1 Tax=Flavobacterium saliperosum TaxID=329186 RepID=A0A1G4VE53_9FLAO|nr:lysoplasmalogenase family protein [Flavobacterium saliperosum]SCX05366.1 YhhN-like protein [Flavobacterium saliperosum]